MKRVFAILTLMGLAVTGRADVDPVFDVGDRVSKLEATVTRFSAELDALSERYESLAEKHNVLSKGYVDLRGCIIEQLESADDWSTCSKLIREHETVSE
jgi:hypothetical protein